MSDDERTSNSPYGTRQRALIIGAGVMGCSIANELTRRGVEVIVVDRRAAAGHGTTGSSSAIVRAHYSTYQGVAIAYESALSWMNWDNHVGNADERGNARLVKVGTLLLKGPDRHHEQVTPLYDQLEVPYEHLTVRQVLDHMPMLDLHSFWPPKRPDDVEFWDEPTSMLDGAIFTPWSGYINDPQLATHNLQRSAESHGASFLFRTEVKAISVVDRRVRAVELTNREVLECDVVVNAAGPHSSRINQMVGADSDMKVRTRLLRHEVHHIPAPKGIDYDRVGHHVSDPDLGIDFRPESGNQISVGSEGPECDPKDWVDDADLFERRVTSRVWEPQILRLARRIPTLGVPNQPRGIADLYDVTDDWIPIYDRSVIDGFYMAIGTSGNQFKNAPTVGYVMSELIRACENGHDHDRKPVQIPARNIDADFDLGYYSRLRAPKTTNLNAMG